MTLQLTLPTDLEERLRLEAERSGQDRHTVALRMLDRHLPQVEAARRAAAVALLVRWAEEDSTLSAEALAANAAVLRALDEDRPAHRKLFADLPEEAPK